MGHHADDPSLQEARGVLQVHGRGGPGGVVGGGVMLLYWRGGRRAMLVLFSKLFLCGKRLDLAIARMLRIRRSSFACRRRPRNLASAKCTRRRFTGMLFGRWLLDACTQA